jgi:hypothetical protein
MHEFFLIGSLPFNLLLGAAFVVLWGCINFESGTGATFTAITVAALLALFGDFNIFKEVHAHPWRAATWIGAYFAVGLIWSFWKFRFFARDRRREHDELLERFLESNGATGLSSPALQDRWVDRLRGDNRFSSDVRTVARDGGTVLLASPLAKRHKAQLITWASYWPWSFTWALFHDAIKRLWEELYATLHTWYQKVSDSSFKGTEIVVTPPGSKDAVAEGYKSRKTYVSGD